MLYEAELPASTFIEPEIVPGVAGAMVGVTAKVPGDEVPQVPLATTLTFPAVAFGVAEILVVVELPVQPPGKVQV